MLAFLFVRLGRVIILLLLLILYLTALKEKNNLTNKKFYAEFLSFVANCHCTSQDS